MYRPVPIVNILLPCSVTAAYTALTGLGDRKWVGGESVQQEQDAHTLCANVGPFYGKDLSSCRRGNLTSPLWIPTDDSTTYILERGRETGGMEEGERRSLQSVLF